MRRTGQQRRVSTDGVVSLEGRRYEVRQSFLAGRRLQVAWCQVEGLAQEAWVEHEGRRYALHPLDPHLNGTTLRPPRQPPAAPSRAFDPSAPDTTPPDAASARAREAGHD